MKEILLFCAGAIVALVSSWLKVVWDRRTGTSDEIFRMRFKAVVEIWHAFSDVKDAYAKKVPKGHANWKRSDSSAALKKLNVFRELVDRHQVVLNSTVVAELRELDAYMFSLINLEDQVPSAYISDLNSRLDDLSKAVNDSLGRPTQEIELRLK